MHAPHEMYLRHLEQDRRVTLSEIKALLTLWPARTSVKLRERVIRLLDDNERHLNVIVNLLLRDHPNPHLRARWAQKRPTAALELTDRHPAVLAAIVTRFTDPVLLTDMAVHVHDPDTPADDRGWLAFWLVWNQHTPHPVRVMCAPAACDHQVLSRIQRPELLDGWAERSFPVEVT